MGKLSRIGEVYAFLWHRRLWWAIPFVSILNLLILPLLLLLWAVQFLRSVGGQRADRMRLERDLKRKGKDLYPLW